MSFLAPRSFAAEAETIVLNPFIVTTESNPGYHASATLSGTQLKSQVRDLANPITILTEEFMRDIGAVNYEEALEFLPSRPEVNTRPAERLRGEAPRGHGPQRIWRQGHRRRALRDYPGNGLCTNVESDLTEGHEREATLNPTRQLRVLRGARLVEGRAADLTGQHRRVAALRR